MVVCNNAGVYILPNKGHNGGGKKSGILKRGRKKRKGKNGKNEKKGKKRGKRWKNGKEGK